MLDHLEIGEAARGTPRSEKKTHEIGCVGEDVFCFLFVFFGSLEDECEQIFWER